VGCSKVQRSERADHLQSTLPSYSHSVSFVHQQKDGLQFGRKRYLCPSKISKCLSGKELFSLCSSPLEAANGMLMFGISTAMIFVVIQRLVQARFADLKD
jgi:hypothetical protein